MKLHLDLLEQADHLSRRENKKPRQASLRRSASGSYYALFHLLSAKMAAIIAPNVHEHGRAQIQRALSQDTMKQVCGRFLQTPLSAPLAALTGTPVSDELRLVALAFVQLQDARHSADYDLNSNWNRARPGNISNWREMLFMPGISFARMPKRTSFFCHSFC